MIERIYQSEPWTKERDREVAAERHPPMAWTRGWRYVPLEHPLSGRRDDIDPDDAPGLFVEVVLRVSCPSLADARRIALAVPRIVERGLSCEKGAQL
ncbi:MAG: hypothetical protein ACOCTI_04375 [Phycisphaeraceae bacterium]